MTTSGPRGLIDQNAESLTAEEWEENVEWHRLSQRHSNEWSVDSVFWVRHGESREIKAHLLASHRWEIRQTIREDEAMSVAHDRMPPIPMPTQERGND